MTHTVLDWLKDVVRDGDIRCTCWAVEGVCRGLSSCRRVQAEDWVRLLTAEGFRRGRSK